MKKVSFFCKSFLVLLALFAASCGKQDVSPQPAKQVSSNDEIINTPLVYHSIISFTPDPTSLRPPFYPSYYTDGRQLIGFCWSQPQSIVYRKQWPMATMVTINMVMLPYYDSHGNLVSPNYNKTFSHVSIYPGNTPSLNGFYTTGVVVAPSSTRVPGFPGLSTFLVPGSYTVTISSEPDFNGYFTSLYERDNINADPTTSISDNVTL